MLSFIPCGDLELNIAHPHGLPTLVPSVELEQALDFRHYAAVGEPSAQLQRLAVHLHVHYLDTLEELLLQLANVHASLKPWDLWISTDSSAKANQISSQIAAHPELDQSFNRLEIRVCPNRGRNIGPLLKELWPDLQDYELLLHLHGKKSIENNLGPQWLHELLISLIPNPAVVAQVRQAFSNDQQLGLLMPQTPEALRPYLNWGSNFELANAMVKGWGRRLPTDGILIFPVGMMFWCRPSALAPLAQSCQELDTLPVEPIPVDGSSLHALERLVGYSCEHAGLRWNLLCNQHQPGTSHASKRINLWQSQADAQQFAMAQLAIRLRHEWEQRQCFETNFLNCEAQLEQHITQANEQLQAADKQLRKADQQLIEADKNLRALMDRLDEMVSELQQIRSSFYWKLTALIRKLSQRLTGRH